MKKHILFIDDDEDELKIFTEVLNEIGTGYKCTWAKSGQQALNQLLYIQPDIIFLDIHMPGMDGFECLGSIKEMQKVKAIPVVLYSTDLHAANYDKGIKLGAAACIKKASDIQHTAETIQQILEAEAIHLSQK